MGFIGAGFVVIRDKYRYSAQRFAQLLPANHLQILYVQPVRIGCTLRVFRTRHPVYSGRAGL